MKRVSYLLIALTLIACKEKDPGNKQRQQEIEKQFSSLKTDIGKIKSDWLLQNITRKSESTKAPLEILAMFERDQNRLQAEVFWFHQQYNALKFFFANNNLKAEATINVDLPQKWQSRCRSGECQLMMNQQVVFIKGTEAEKFAGEFASSFKKQTKIPGITSYLPYNERYKGSLKFFQNWQALQASFKNCAVADYRWAKEGKLFICDIGEKPLAMKLQRQAFGPAQTQITESVAKRSGTSIVIRYAYAKDEDKLLYGIYQSGPYIFGLTGRISASLARAIINEVSQSLPALEKAIEKKGKNS